MPYLQDRPVDPHPTPHCCGLRLFAGAHDRRYLMTAINIQFTKSLPDSLGLAKPTGNPCLERWSLRLRTAGFSRQPRDIALPSGRAMISATQLSRREMLSEALIKQAAIQS